MPATDSPRGGRLDLITEAARDALDVRRVVGDPLVHGDTMVIPVARIRGGSGSGFGSGSVDAGGRRAGHPANSPQADTPPGEDAADSLRGAGRGDGGGGGFGVSARVLGAYVVKGEDVVWRPAVDVTRVILAGQAVAAITVLAVARAVRRRSPR
jgi:uncharacterized spore protein YtfJ